MKIEVHNGKLVVPDTPTIPFIEGDGVGRDIWPATQRVIEQAVAKAYFGKRNIQWREVLAGERAFELTGEWLPEATIEAFANYLVGIKGPLTTPIGGGIRSLNVALRQKLDLYVSLRPTQYFAGVLSPLLHPERVDMTMFRENTEDIYAGIEWQAGSEQAQQVIDFLQNEMGVRNIRFPESSAIGIKPISRQGSERLVRAAVEYAIKHHKPSLTIVHKGNIQKFTEGGFKNWGYDVCENEFTDHIFSMREWEKIKAEQGEAQANQALIKAQEQGRVVVKDCIADAFLQNTLLHPEHYSVIATTNLNGDYMSDQAAAMVGGIGIAPGANINYQSLHAIFEATHGTAPTIAGRGVANPCSLLLSSAMMLDYIGWGQAATIITKAIADAIAAGQTTADLAPVASRALSTSAFAQVLIDKINEGNAVCR
ncbi:MAG: NADP-dependent isocitrate dehydrogenase [Mucinivorans sp.]